MRKRTKFKSPVLDVFVVVLFLSVAGHFSYAFWKDLNSTARRTDKEKIAIITFKNRIAQRKFDDRVVWERIDKSTPLYNGDLVKTADLAEAVITFNDGSEVNITENTMIQVYYNDKEGLQISLNSGNLQLESSDNSKVQLTLGDGSKVSAGGGTSLSTKSTGSGSGASTVAVRSGSAVVTGSSGAVEALNSGETLSVKSTGEISRKPVTVVSIPPELKVLNVEGGKVPVKLEWNTDNSSQPVIIQTSTKKDFSEIKDAKTVTSENDSLLNVSDGILYWRVFTEGHEDEASEGKISIATPDPVQLISPAEAGSFRFRNRNPVLNFSWKGNDYAQNYLLRISSTPDMLNPVVELTTLTPFVQLDSIGNGQWWWQVTPYYDSIGYAGASKIATFNVIKNDDILPPALTVPLQQAELYYKDTPSVNFSWKSDIKASYELLLAADKDFTDIIARKNTAGQRVTVNLQTPEKDGQEYYWKVIRNSSEADDLSPESEVRSFTLSEYISLPTRLLYPPEDYSTELSKLASTSFMWKPSDESKNKDAVIQVAASSDFKYLQLERTISGNTFDNMMLPQGDWYWRVGTVSADGTMEYTQPRHLLVQKELTVPDIINIKENSKLVVAKNSSVKVSWTKVPDADYYNVRIFDSENQVAAENAEARGSSANFLLPAASYTVKIQAVSAQTANAPLRTGPVKSVSFSVRYPDAITALTPAASTKVDGLTALRTPTVFSWKAGRDLPSSTELVIKKRQADGSVKVIERIKTTKTSVSVPRLTTGSYTWQIIASTKDGLPLNSQEKSFTVTAVADLPRPVLTNPEKAFVIDAAFLRKNRSILFEWEEVPDATEYSFVLYRKDKNGNRTAVYSEKKIKTNKLKYKKLALLDLGDFEWNVTAYSYAKDGYEERRSPLASANFTISFDRPKQITTEQTGRMYSDGAESE